MFLQSVARLAEELPSATVESLAGLLEAQLLDAEAGRSPVAEGATPVPAAQSAIRSLLREWAELKERPSPEALAWALRAACAADRRQSERESVELVWTGPTPPHVKLRRIDQALLELIRGAKRELMLVTFAAYKVPELRQALLDATDRGVKLTFLLETVEDSRGKVTFDPIKALGEDLASRAEVWHWPLDQRPRDEKGRHGRLHAKLAIADRERLLVSSANLTEYAMRMNLECGLAVSGGSTAGALSESLGQLLRQGILTVVK